jgi:sulfotransferase
LTPEDVLGDENMEKTYHFMAGLPRSGSTVLAALLNQHPDIYSSPQTDLLSMLYELDQKIPNYESYKAGLMHPGYKSVMANIANNFYGHIQKPIVIDKNRGWGTPYNFNNLSQYLNINGKVILTLRPILEVLASFIKAAEKTEATLGSTPYLKDELWVSHYREKRDAQVDSLMQNNGEIDRAIFSIFNLLKTRGDKIFVVWFDDILEKPQETLNGIYNFLEVDSFENDFKSVQPIDLHDDVAGYGVVDLHSVSKVLKKPDTSVTDYLSNYAISKYKNSLDFLWG